MSVTAQPEPNRKSKSNIAMRVAYALALVGISSGGTFLAESVLNPVTPESTSFAAPSAPKCLSIQGLPPLESMTGSASSQVIWNVNTNLLDDSSLSVRGKCEIDPATLVSLLDQNVNTGAEAGFSSGYYDLERQYKGRKIICDYSFKRFINKGYAIKRILCLAEDPNIASIVPQDRDLHAIDKVPLAENDPTALQEVSSKLGYDNAHLDPNGDLVFGSGSSALRVATSKEVENFLNFRT